MGYQKPCKISVPSMLKKKLNLSKLHAANTFAFLLYILVLCYHVSQILISHRISCSKSNSIPPFFFSPIMLIVQINSLKEKKKRVRLIKTAFLIKAAENQYSSERFHMIIF